MSSLSIRQTYVDYLAAITTRNWKQVTKYVNSTIVHNGKTMSAEGYANMIETSLKPFAENLAFDIERLVVDEDTGEAACRILFTVDGKPNPPYFEHVFYQFQAGRISQVWSLVNHSGSP